MSATLGAAIDRAGLNLKLLAAVFAVGRRNFALPVEHELDGLPSWFAAPYLDQNRRRLDAAAVTRFTALNQGVRNGELPKNPSPSSPTCTRTTMLR